MQYFPNFKNIFADVLKNPLTVMFDQILEQKQVPNQWLTSEIIYFIKKGR